MTFLMELIKCVFVYFSVAYLVVIFFFRWNFDVPITIA